MKSFAAIAAIAALASTASAATCGGTQLSALLTNPNLQQCGTDSGYVFTAASIPDADTIAKMCASTACNSLIADAQALNLEECQLPVGDGINLRADLIDYVPANCPTGEAPAAATEAPAAVTEAPTGETPATEAPVEMSTEAPVASDNSTDAATPAPTTTAISC